MNIIQKLVGANHSKGRTHTPVGIVIHTEVGSQSGTYAWFNNPASGVSAHYNIGYDGSIWQHVSEGDRAYAQGSVYNQTSPLVRSRGTLNPNEYLISIEHEDKGNPADGSRTTALYEASGWLVAQICKRYGIPNDTIHIIDHREIRANKTCPGGLDSYRIMAIADRYLKPPPPPPAPSPPVVTPVVNKYIRFATPLKMVTNKQANLWNFNKKGFSFDIVKTLTAGQEFEAYGEAQHSNGGIYYMTAYSFGNAEVDGSPSFPYGINKIDLNLVPPPAPTPVPVPPTPTPVPEPIVEPPVPPQDTEKDVLKQILEILKKLLAFFGIK